MSRKYLTGACYDEQRKVRKNDRSHQPSCRCTDADMKKLCDEARKNLFRIVAINPAQVKRCKEFLKGTDVHAGAAISFPLGQETLAVKVYSVKDAIENGRMRSVQWPGLPKTLNRILSKTLPDLNQVVQRQRMLHG